MSDRTRRTLTPGLFAFWEYDDPPALGAPIIEMFPSGMVIPKGYGGSSFRPLIIMPEKEGAALLGKIKEIDHAHRAERAAMSLKYRALYEGLLWFLPRKKCP